MNLRFFGEAYVDMEEGRLTVGGLGCPKDLGNGDIIRYEFGDSVFVKRNSPEMHIIDGWMIVLTSDSLFSDADLTTSGAINVYVSASHVAQGPFFKPIRVYEGAEVLNPDSPQIITRVSVVWVIPAGSMVVVKCNDGRLIHMDFNLRNTFGPTCYFTPNIRVEEYKGGALPYGFRAVK